MFHLLSFEGPDPYSSAGGVATRVSGLARALAQHAETHLWFVGDPRLPGHETRGNLHLHRWCQWLSEHHPRGVYDGEVPKVTDYTASLPHAVLPFVREGGPCVVLAEDWHTAPAVLHLHALLRRAELRDRAQLFFNVNNTLGFGRLDWEALGESTTVTTISRYMRGLVRQHGVEAVVIPNGLTAEALEEPDAAAVTQLREDTLDRMLLVKLARWVPEKRWLLAIETVSLLKARGLRPLLVVRAGIEPHSQEVLARGKRAGLTITEATLEDGTSAALAAALAQRGDVDVLVLDRRLDVATRSALFAAADVVLANSSHEPFGMVGLEAMAAGGVACVGCTGEDYAMPGRNALVLQTDEPGELVQLWSALTERPERLQALRREARDTARRRSFADIVEQALLPRLQRRPSPPRADR